MNLLDKRELTKYLKQNNLWAKKSLGQNFLVDEGVLNKIVEVAELKPTDIVIEIGPGLGVLTEKLVEKVAKVVAVEKDEQFAKLLNDKFQISNNKQNEKIQITNADILDLNMEEILRPPIRQTQDDKKIIQDNRTGIQASKVSYKLIANIPYYITGKVFRKFLSVENKPELIVMLVQKEVAERICAKPGKMSLLSASVQAYGEPKIVKIVKSSSFYPVPKVDSAILKVESIKYQVHQVSEKEFFRCVKIGFSSKRKTLLNNLSAGYHMNKDELSDILRRAGLNNRSRAQELNIGKWQELTKIVKSL